MALLSILEEVLGSPVGSFAYHLVILLAVQAALGIVWSERQRVGREGAWRVLLAMVGLTVVRLPYVGIALIASTGWIGPETLLPPLERFADTASIGLLAWAFAAPAGRGVRAWDLLFGANLILAMGVCAGFTPAWNRTLIDHASLDYNTHWQSSVWSVWQMALIPIAGLAVLRGRRAGRGVALCSMLFMLVGRPLQTFVGTDVLNLAVWERLANLVAYLLIPAAIYLSTVSDLHERIHSLEQVSETWLDQIKSYILLLETGQRVSGSLNLSSVLNHAAQGIARTCNADECAIALHDESVPGNMSLAAVYNPERQGRAEAQGFPLELQAIVQRAMRRRKAVIVDEAESRQLQVLFSLLGSTEAGPVMVQPLLFNDEAIGAIIAGTSRSRRPFRPHDAKLCEYLAEQLVTAIQNARRYQAARDRIREMRESRESESRAPQMATPPRPRVRHGGDGRAERDASERQRVPGTEVASRFQEPSSAK